MERDPESSADLEFDPKADYVAEIIADREEEAQDADGSLYKQVRSKTEIEQYELAHSVNQDILAKSYIHNGAIFRTLQDKGRVAMNDYYAIEKTHGPDDPATLEAKQMWDAAVVEKDKQGAFMKELVDHMTSDTKKRYMEDLIANGLIDPGNVH